MAKISGLGAKVQVDTAGGSQEDISNDCTEFSLATPRALQVITGVDKSATERLAVLADGSVSLKGIFNNASNLSHQVMSGIGTEANTRTVQIAPTASSGAAPYLAMETLFSDYTVQRSANADLTWDAKAELADGTVPAWTNS